MSSLDLEDRPIIAFDLDGTLLNQQGGIHPRDVALLTMADPPAVFVPATGRSLFAVRRAFLSAGIINGNPIPFPLVLQNGALIFARGEKKLLYKVFEPGVQKDLIEICKTISEASFLLFGESDLRILNPTPFGLGETERYMFIPREFTDDDPHIGLSKIMCLSDNPDLLKELALLVAGFEIEVAQSESTLLEFNPAGVTKGSGLEVLVKYHNWNKNNIFCAGDAENDLGMFDKFRNSFAPSSSPENIRKKAANIIDTRENGLLTPILQYIGIGK